VVSIPNGVTPVVMGIFLSMISGNQVFYHKFNLNLMLKAPIYETNADANKQSPIMVKVYFLSYLTVSFHLLFSPARPLTNLMAALNLASQLAASYSTAYLVASASAN